MSNTDKILPPIVSDTIPAFVKNENNQMIEIKIPFSFGRVTNLEEINFIFVKISQLQSNSLVGDIIPIQIRHTSTGEILSNVLKKINNIYELTCRLLFNEKNPAMLEGNYYKFQIAFSNSQNADISSLYFSTPMIGKFTYLPVVKIEGLEEFGISVHKQVYVGSFDQTGKDPSEKEYSYSFSLFDKFDNLIYTTGNLIHDSSQDTSLTSSSDLFLFTKELPYGSVFSLEYRVITINGLNVVKRYQVMAGELTPIHTSIQLNPVKDRENGSIKIKLEKKENINESDYAIGNYILSRSNEKEGYKNWEELFFFSIDIEEDFLSNNIIYEDFTIEHNTKYKYSIQRINSFGIYSSREISPIVTGDLEYMYLYDGIKQLKIKFNPKMTSLKLKKANSKVDTLGSKYPFIFKSGEMEYYEFPISGLISRLMDEEHYFMPYDSEEELSPFDTSLNGINIGQEKTFKIEVLKWLSDGKKKVFRTPTEGNFIVHLTDCQLTPIDTLGRMLHSFNCNAVEIEEFNLSNLKKSGFIQIEESFKDFFQWRTIELQQPIYNDSGRIIGYQSVFEKYKNDKLHHIFDSEKGIVSLNRIGETVLSIKIDSMIPGSSIDILYNGSSELEKFVIGWAGSLVIDSGTPIDAVYIGKDSCRVGSIHLKTKKSVDSNFDNIVNIKSRVYPKKEIYGQTNAENKPTDVLNLLQKEEQGPGRDEVTITEVRRVYTLYAKKKPVVEVYKFTDNENISFYIDSEKTKRQDINPKVIYAVKEIPPMLGTGEEESPFIVQKEKFIGYFSLPYMPDSNNITKKEFDEGIRYSEAPTLSKQPNPEKQYDIDYSINLNEELFSVIGVSGLKINDSFTDLSKLTIGEGVLLELFYLEEKIIKKKGV